MPATGALIGTPASMSASVEPQTERHRGRAVRLKHSETMRIVYGNSSSAGSTARSARSARQPWPISRRPGPRMKRASPTEYGGKL